MYTIMIFWALGFLVLVLTGQPISSATCKFPAIYNFGDSNSDTGVSSASIKEVAPPNGETFFGKPAGRFCDGRLIIDFIAEDQKLPYLSPYLNSTGPNFRHGANFATAGASIRPGGYSPFHLAIQVDKFIKFKASATHPGHRNPFRSKLPHSKEFSKALYTIDIGQNDLAYGFQHTNEAQVRASIPEILSQFSSSVRVLYNEGARFFWVHNTGPIGCLPYAVIYDQRKPFNLDESGCVKPQNDVAMEFNRQLKNSIAQLRTQLPRTVFTYVDVYKAKYALIRYAKVQGFVDPFDFCCGNDPGHRVDCGRKEMVNGTVYGNPCKDPEKHISWDGIHYTEAANRWVANWILTGSLSDPPVSVKKACS